MPTIRRFAAALLAGVGLGYLVYPPPAQTEEAEITAEQLHCEAVNAQKQPRDKPVLRSADEVLAFVAEKYGSFSTYMDSGDFETTWDNCEGQRVSRSTHFNLAFQRPDRLRIRLSDAITNKIVCFDHGQAVTCLASPDQVCREPSFETALLGASVSSDGLLDWLTSLLMPDTIDQSVWRILSNATLTVEDSDCNRKVYVIYACAGEDAVQLWVDPESFLVSGLEIITLQPDFQLTRFVRFFPSRDLIICNDELRLSTSYAPDYFNVVRIRDFEPSNEIPYAIGVAYGGVQIKGSDQYIKSVNGAFDLLQKRDPESLRLALKYLAVIDEDDPIGVLPGDVPTLGLPRGSARYSPDFCAALLVYYAQQSKLYSDYREKSGMQPPVDVWTGPAAIHACSERAKQSLIKLKAVPFNIEYMMANEVTLADPASWYPLDLSDRK